MARSSYQYETSPRKLQPNYKNRKRLEVIENVPKNNRLNKEAKKKRKKQIFLVIVIFATFLVISYRNSLINEEFKIMQSKKNDLSIIQKENKQIEIALESSLNLNNIEKIATEQLGMQKQSNAQTIYIELDKEDYIEVSTEEIQEENKGFLEKILGIFKK